MILVGGERLVLSGRGGRTRVSGAMRIYYEGLRNIVISADAVEKFFEEYGHEKAAYELLKLQKEWLKNQIQRVEELIKFGYDIQSFRDELTEYKSDLKLVEALLEELEKKQTEDGDDVDQLWIEKEVMDDLEEERFFARAAW